MATPMVTTSMRGNDSSAENDDSDDDDADAHDLGALNAAHASDTALANASPNSRVGKIAAYKDAEIAAKAAAADAAAADQARRRCAGGSSMQRLAANADADPVNDVDQTTIDGLTQDVADAQAAAATVDASAQTAQDDADAALVNASNKDITDADGNVFSDVRDAVDHLLGIDLTLVPLAMPCPRADPSARGLTFQGVAGGSRWRSASQYVGQNIRDEARGGHDQHGRRCPPTTHW